MAALETYYFELRHALNSKIIALKIVKRIIAWKKKIDFADLVTDAKSVAGSSPSRQF